MKKILIIDKNLEEADLLKEILEEDYEIKISDTAKGGLEEANSGRYSLILLSEAIPEMTDFLLLKELQEKVVSRNFPILVIADSVQAGEEERGIMLGAVDYITSPFKPMLVRSRIHTYIKLYEYRIHEEQEQAMTDQLTGVSSRRRYELHNIVKWREAVRLQVPISICMFDIDEFRVYNDTYGYPAGDKALARVANLIAPELKRSTDFFARFEGDQFIAIILGGSAADVSEHLRKICQEVENLHITNKTEDSEWLTVSIGGVTVIPQIRDEYESYVKAAETMLQEAKKAGKNQVAWK